MRFRSSASRERLAQVLYILSGIALVCGLSMAILFFHFNFDAEAPDGQQFTVGFVARTEWQILLMFGLLLAWACGLISAWVVSRASDDA